MNIQRIPKNEKEEIIAGCSSIILPMIPKVVGKLDRQQWDSATDVIYNKYNYSTPESRESMPDFIGNFLESLGSMTPELATYTLKELGRINTEVDSVREKHRSADLESMVLNSTTETKLPQKEISLMHDILFELNSREISMKYFTEFRTAIENLSPSSVSEAINFGKNIVTKKFQNEDADEKGRILVLSAQTFSQRAEALGNKIREWTKNTLDSSPNLNELRAHLTDRYGYFEPEITKAIGGVSLSDVHGRLLAYTQALTGEKIKIEKSEGHGISCSFDGTSFYLPQNINIGSTPEENISLYRALCSYLSGAVMFETYEIDLSKLNSPRGHAVKEKGLESFFDSFQNPGLAKSLFEILEVKRLESKLRKRFSGLKKDLEEFSRHYSSGKSGDVITELKQQLFLGETPRSLKDLEDTLAEANERISSDSSGVESSLEATELLYDKLAQRVKTKEQPKQQINFNIQTVVDLKKSPDYLVATPETGLVLGKRFRYPEWNFSSGDYKPEFVQVVERGYPAESNSGYVSKVLQEDKGAIGLIRRAFETMTPEEFQKVKRQISGDINYEELVRARAEEKAGVTPSEKIFDREYKNQRSVASLVLAESSGSLRKFIDLDNPDLRTVDMIKRAQIYFAEALDVVGDRYALASYSGETERNVEFYLLKNFDDRYDDKIRGTIGSLKPLKQNRDGAGIRHATRLLSAQPERLKLLFYLMEGVPHDFGYEKQYAVEDTKRAIVESKKEGCIPVAISFGKYADPSMRTIANHCTYVEVSNPLTLPAKLPEIYRRMTG